MHSGQRTRTVLTIAGSDSGGGAGIQADLKAFARCGVHGASAITAVTAQNTSGVIAIHAIPPDIVLAQVRAVLADIRVDAVKVGMIGTLDGTHAVARALDELPRGTPVVVDPVMVAESGARLLADGAREALVDEIVPRARVLTPNLPEALALTGHSAGIGAHAGTEGATAGPVGGDDSGDGGEDEALARALLALGCGAVVVTGGHGARGLDIFAERDEQSGKPAMASICGPRHRDGAAHGSGCTHSSVLAASLALGRTPLQAARVARALAGEAIAHGLRDVGAGAGPVDVLDIASMRSCEPAPGPAP